MEARRKRRRQPNFYFHHKRGSLSILPQITCEDLAIKECLLVFKTLQKYSRLDPSSHKGSIVGDLEVVAEVQVNVITMAVLRFAVKGSAPDPSLNLQQSPKLTTRIIITILILKPRETPVKKRMSRESLIKTANWPILLHSFVVWCRMYRWERRET